VTKSEAIKHYGSVRLLAEALGVWVQTVYKWPERLPARWQYELYYKTGGALQVDESLRDGAVNQPIAASK